MPEPPIRAVFLAPWAVTPRRRSSLSHLLVLVLLTAAIARLWQARNRVSNRIRFGVNAEMGWGDELASDSDGMGWDSGDPAISTRRTWLKRVRSACSASSRGCNRARASQGPAAWVAEWWSDRDHGVADAASSWGVPSEVPAASGEERTANDPFVPLFTITNRHLETASGSAAAMGRSSVL